MPFFMALLGTDRLCSRWGSGDAVLQLLRNQHVVNTRLTSTVRIERLWHTVWVHTSSWNCCLHCCIHRIRLYLSRGRNGDSRFFLVLLGLVRSSLVPYRSPSVTARVSGPWTSPPPHPTHKISRSFSRGDDCSSCIDSKC